MNDIKLRGKEYDKNNNILYELKNNGKRLDYGMNGYLEFEVEYLNGLKNGKGKNIILMVILNLKENIYITKNGKVKDMMNLIILYMN